LWIDGNFPNHQPDFAKTVNKLHDLIQALLINDVKIGLIFDKTRVRLEIKII